MRCGGIAGIVLVRDRRRDHKVLNGFEYCGRVLYSLLFIDSVGDGIQSRLCSGVEVL